MSGALDSNLRLTKCPYCVDVSAGVLRPITQCCDDCDKDLSSAPTTGVISRQVFDLPPVALLTTEHHAMRRRCECGSETTGAFPPEATAPARYGPRLRAYVCYLVTRQHIPVATVAELLCAFGDNPDRITSEVKFA